MTSFTMNQPAHQHAIVVLHSKCRSHEQGALEVNAESNSHYPLDVEDLASQPISCDLLVLPEIPPQQTTETIDESPTGLQSDETENPLYVEILDKQLNPCGMTNVLVLENLPWTNVLLSLTSCSVSYGEKGKVPVEPSPSSFHFNIERMRKPTADIFIEFDFSFAFEKQTEIRKRDTMLKQQHALRNDEGAERDSPKNSGGEKCRRLAAIAKVHHLNSTGDTVNFKFPISGRSGIAGPNKYTHLPAPVVPVRDCNSWHDETIHRIQLAMEHETAYLDRILGVLAVVGIGLFMLLAWAGIQVYRSKKEQQGILEMHETILERLTLKSQLNMGDNQIVVGQEDVFPSEEILTVPKASTSERSALSHTHQLATTKRMEASSPPEKQPVTPKAKRNLCSNSPKLKQCKSDVNMEAAKPDASSPVDEAPDADEDQNTPGLSPFSKLALEWAEKKTIRRSNRKARGRDILAPTPQDLIQESETASPIQGPPALYSMAGSMSFQPAKNIDQRSSRGVGCTDRSAIRCLYQEFASHLQPSRCPQRGFLLPTSEVDSTDPPMPEVVCSTPGSANTFVEDYW